MLNQIKRYLEETVQDDVQIHKWMKASTLIFRFQDRFNFYEINLLGHLIVLVEENGTNSTLNEMIKLMVQIKSMGIEDCAMVFTEITNYKRKEMIQAKIPFIIADKQMYLPFLGLDLKLPSKKETNKPEFFTPTGQLLYLYFLYNKSVQISNNDLSTLFRISKMHASRSLRELYDKKLITFELGGSTKRTRIYKRIDDPEYYQRGFNYLRNPVVEVIYCDYDSENKLKSGLSSLAERSMLSEPENITFAITKDERRNIDSSSMNQYKDKGTELEVWSYNPKIISDDNNVDILSLYLSLRDLDDPRVDEAIENLLRDESWYK